MSDDFPECLARLTNELTVLQRHVSVAQLSHRQKAAIALCHIQIALNILSDKDEDFTAYSTHPAQLN